MKKALLGATALSAAFMASASFAQTAAQTDDNGENDVIVVYTQKRAQALTDVPIAVTAYTSEQLKDLGVQQFDDLADFIPGLEVQEQSPNNPGFVIRGITSDSGEATTEPRVTIFQDGVSISRSRGSFVELFDANVEVARGPQSTLFGRSALIGAINIIQNKPTYEYDAEIRAALGNYDYQLYDGFVNVPLIDDTLALRGAARYKKRDGYIENGLGGTDFQGVELAAFRGSLRFDPAENLRADVIFNYQSDNNTGSSFKSGTFIPSGGDINPSAAADLNTFGGFEGGTELGIERELWSVTGLIEYQLNDAITINSVTGYRDFDSLEVFDPDGFGLPLFVFAEDAQGDQFSQEIRVRYDDGGMISGFAGVSYFHEDGFQRVPLQFDERLTAALLSGDIFAGGFPGQPQPTLPLAVFTDPSVNPLLPASIALLSPAHAEEFTNFGETDAYDFFADVTIKPADRLEIIVGARYTTEDKRSGFSAGLISGPSLLALSSTGSPGLLLGDLANLNFSELSTKDSFDGFTWRGVINYEVNDDVDVYFNYGRGRRPEVVDFDETAGVFDTLPAEIVSSYEGGLKARLFDNRLSVDGALYYYTYTNFQSSRVVGGFPVTFNAGNADSIGFETAIVGQPTEWARLFATYTYNHTRFEDFGDDGEPQAFAGNQFRLNPDHALTVGGAFTKDCDYGSLTLMPTYTYKTKIFFDNDNDFAVNPRNGAILQEADFFQDEFQEAYGIFDLRLRFDDKDERFSAELFVENLFDKEFIIDAGNTGDAFGIPTFIGGAPRFFGGSITVRY